MKLLEQFGIILTLTFIVETFKELVPLPVPSSVYGLVLMLLLLKFKILNISAIKDASKLLIETMPIMFIPAAVGLLNAWNVIRDLLIPLTLVASSFFLLTRYNNKLCYMTRNNHYNNSS